MNYGFYTETYENLPSIDTLGTGDGKTLFTVLTYPDDKKTALGLGYGRGQGVGVLVENDQNLNHGEAGVVFQIKFESVGTIDSLMGILSRIREQQLSFESPLGWVPNADVAFQKYLQSMGGAESYAWHDAPVDGVFKAGYAAAMLDRQFTPKDPECVTCAGRGEIQASERIGESDFREWEETCPVCDGVGAVSQHVQDLQQRYEKVSSELNLLQCKVGAQKYTKPHTYLKEVHEGWPEYSQVNLFSDGQGGGKPLYLAEPPKFQSRIKNWMQTCFGEQIANDKVERNHRFLEEALELVQACGCSKDEAYKLVDYVYGREVGEKSQEVGGVMVTLAALCLAQDIDMQNAADTEISRIEAPEIIERIRAKQKSKPQFSPLPGSYPEREPFKSSDTHDEY